LGFDGVWKILFIHLLDASKRLFWLNIVFLEKELNLTNAGIYIGRIRRILFNFLIPNFRVHSLGPFGVSFNFFARHFLQVTCSQNGVRIGFQNISFCPHSGGFGEMRVIRLFTPVISRDELK
jgi:hypothetical protein